MKNILIIYPHWPPSNLTGIHRARLISNYLPEFNWHPIVLTVESSYYEEVPDYDLIKTVASTTELIYTKAYKPLKMFRFIGDIGLRSFPFIYKKALEIINEKDIDFIWIPIPSFYMSLVGNLLFKKKNVPFGIDYIDPWVRPLALHESRFSRAGFSKYLAKLFEPLALKNVSLVSGVAEEYYLPALNRNKLIDKIRHVAMPYGFDPNDHKVKPSNVLLPWYNSSTTLNFVYAGAFLPKSHLFLKKLFKVIREYAKRNTTKKFKFYFIGTGVYGGKQIIEYAKDYDIQEYVVELNDRLPFLNILNILSESDGILVLGSTEPHYTASKIFQSILSKKPVLPIFHKKSTAIRVLKEANSDDFLTTYDPDEDIIAFEERLAFMFESYMLRPNNWDPNLNSLDKYSAKNSTKKLVAEIEKIV